MGALTDGLDNKMLASFVPALVMKELEKGDALQLPSSQQYEAVALFADISGFSHLNEYFAQLGGVGLGKMMALLNVYFQKMIKICTSCGGDVIKFAGDALIVLWVNEPLAKLAHRACECALELQDSLHDTEITPEISLSLKVGVGLGSATMFYVGGHADRFEYFAAGPALKECFSAADVAEKGDVIVASSVFEQVRDACQAERMQDGHYCVMAMRQTFRKRALNRVCTPALTPQALAVLRSYAPPVLLHASELEKQLKQTVRSWTVSVVHASIIFIHFGIEGVMDLLALDSAKIHKAIVTVQERVHRMRGSIHRFTVDDKGCVMKVVFGADLPHEDQPYRALLTALHLRQALSLQGIQPAFGVASGASLAGPVGGVSRQEFTVHGDRVVLAARLMQLAAKLGGMVLCDEDTHGATRDDIRFVRLRPVNIKGKRGLYQPYRPVASSEILEKPTPRDLVQSEYHPTPEAQQVQSACSDWAAKGDGSACRVLIINGAHGAGKTQLLMQSRKTLERHCRVIHVRCRAHERGIDGALARRLFAQLCGYDVWASLKHIVPTLSNLEAADPSPGADDDHLLNVALQLLLSTQSAARSSFDSPESAMATPRGSEGGLEVPSAPSEDEALRSEHGGQDVGRRLALLIDDVHYADQHSCRLLQKLAASTTVKSGPMLLVVASRDERASLSKDLGSDEQRISDGRRLVHMLTALRHCLRVQLHPLSPEASGRLSCATLGVRSIPSELVELFARRTGGSPLLCQAITRTLEARGLLHVDEGASSCILAEHTTAAAMDAIATSTIVATSHSVLHVRLASLKMLQQLLLKVMSLLPGACTLSQLHQALPFPLEMTELTSQMQVLRSRQIVQLKPTSTTDLRQSLLDLSQSPARKMRRQNEYPQEVRRHSVMPQAKAAPEEQYEFADVGMREVCSALMVDSQQRQIRWQRTGSFGEDELELLPSPQSSFKPEVAKSPPRLKHECSSITFPDSPQRPPQLSVGSDARSSFRGLSPLSPGAWLSPLGVDARSSFRDFAQSLRLSTPNAHRRSRNRDDSLRSSTNSMMRDSATNSSQSSQPASPREPQPSRFRRTLGLRSSQSSQPASPREPQPSRFRRTLGLIANGPLAPRRARKQVHPQAQADETSLSRIGNTSSNHAVLAAAGSSCSEYKPPATSRSPKPHVARRLVFTDAYGEQACIAEVHRDGVDSTLTVDTR